MHALYVSRMDANLGAYGYLAFVLTVVLYCLFPISLLSLDSHVYQLFMRRVSGLILV